MLSNKFVAFSELEYTLVNQVLKSGSVCGKSTLIKQYEASINNTFNSIFAIACSNGTAALQMAFYALDIGPLDEVLLPPTAPIMSILPILSVGATPIFVDVDKTGFGLSVEDLQRKISPKTKAIISVPMWGYPIRMEDIIQIAKQYNLPIVEDCSQAHLTKIKGKNLGTFGDIGIFSTHERKLMTTGEGAFILLKEQLLYNKFQKIKFFGIDNYKNHCPEMGVYFGLNYKLSALNAALGLGQLSKLKNKIQQRTHNATYLKSAIKVGWLKELAYPKEGIPNYYTLIMEVGLSLKKKKEFETYLYHNGILSDTYKLQYQPLYKYALFRQEQVVCANSEKRCATIITLPIHEGLKRENLNYMASIINNF